MIGVGGALLAAAEAWARGKGRAEMGSDCLLDNDVSLAAHRPSGTMRRSGSSTSGRSSGESPPHSVFDWAAAWAVPGANTSTAFTFTISSRP